MSPCALSAYRAFHSTEMLAFPCKKHTLASLLGAAAPHFAFRAICLPRLPQHRNFSVRCKTYTLAFLIGGCGTSFRFALYLPPAPSTAQECQQFQCKTHTLAFLIGGCGTSFRLACYLPPAPAFHSTGMSAFPMQNVYCGTPYRGPRHLISPCALSASRAFQSTGMSAFPVQNV